MMMHVIIVINSRSIVYVAKFFFIIAPSLKKKKQSGGRLKKDHCVHSFFIISLPREGERRNNMDLQSPPTPMLFTGPVDSDKLKQAKKAAETAATALRSRICLISIAATEQRLPLEQQLSGHQTSPKISCFLASPSASDSIVQYAVADPESLVFIFDDAYLLKDLPRCVSLLWHVGKHIFIVSEDRSINLEPLSIIAETMVHCIVKHCPAKCAKCLAEESAIVSCSLHSSPHVVAPLYSPRHNQSYVSLCYGCFRSQQLLKPLVIKRVGGSGSGGAAAAASTGSNKDC
jgi:hypothetical protein